MSKSILTEHNCESEHNVFCHVCSKFEISSLRKVIDDGIRRTYKDIFGFDMDDIRIKNWAPNIICNCCRIMFSMWKKEKNKKNIRFSVPTIWKRPSGESNCFYCCNKIQGYNKNNKSQIVYIQVPSVVAPVLATAENSSTSNSSHMHPPEVTDKMKVDELVDIEEEGSFEMNDESDSCMDDDNGPSSKKPKLISQVELNDLVRNLGLPKDGSEFLASFLKQHNVLEPKTKVSFYRNREVQFRQFFTKDESHSLVYCTDIKGLINELKFNSYNAKDLRLFVDSSKRSIKAVLLHNTNVYAPIPIAHSIVMQETYVNMDILLQKIDYKTHSWQLCGDLKILTIFLGQQSGFTKFPCYLCLWDSRDRKNHFVKKNWPPRTSFTPGSQNVIHESLVDPSKILIPPLHIKLGLMKQFVKALDKSGACFAYLVDKFPKLSEAKLKEGIFDGPQIRKMFQDTTFISKMNREEKNAWQSFKAVAQNFLGNRKSPDYKQIVSKMISDFHKLQCNMNLKLHFLDSHLDEFPENLGDFSEEQGERFHQDIKVMETRYQGRWDVNMMADYCWTLKRESTENQKRNRSSLHRSFENKRTRYSSKKNND